MPACTWCKLNTDLMFFLTEEDAQRKVEELQEGEQREIPD